MTAPPWWTPPADAAAAEVRARPGAAAVSAQPLAERSAPRPGYPAAARRASALAARTPPGQALRPSLGAGAAPASSMTVPPEAPFDPPPPEGALRQAHSDPLAAVPATFEARSRAGRWSLSAWSFVRRGEAAPLANGGLLGGSQAGARVAFRLNRDRARPLALSARLSAPLRRTAGAEAALGLDWRPSRRLPVHILAERRQALGREGRSAFGVTLYGGVGDAPLGPFRIDAYAQAGLVGARSRDPFGDSAIRVSLPLGHRARLGAGAWAAAQPGASRIDIGPQTAVRLTVAGRPVTLAADWRLRVAGTAEPGSGPTLTLSSDF